MKIVTFYKTDTGEVTGTSVFSDIYVVAVPEDEACVQGEIDGSKFYIVDQLPVSYPPRPHIGAEFDYATGQWVDGRTLGQLKVEAKRVVMEMASTLLSGFTTGYPNEEVLSWGLKLTAARSAALGNSEPMIEIEAQVLGITSAALAARVISKGEPYEAIVASVAGVRGKAYAAIDAAVSVSEVDAAVGAATVSLTN